MAHEAPEYHPSPDTPNTQHRTNCVDHHSDTSVLQATVRGSFLLCYGWTWICAQGVQSVKSRLQIVIMLALTDSCVGRAEVLPLYNNNHSPTHGTSSGWETDRCLDWAWTLHAMLQCGLFSPSVTHWLTESWMGTLKDHLWKQQLPSTHKTAMVRKDIWKWISELVIACLKA